MDQKNKKIEDAELSVWFFQTSFFRINGHIFQT